MSRLITAYLRGRKLRELRRIRFQRAAYKHAAEGDAERGYPLPRWVAEVHEHQRRQFGSGNGREVAL